MSISLDGDDERTLTMVQDVDASDLIQESLPVPVHDDIIEAGSSQGMEGAILQGLGNDTDVEQSKQVEENKRNILALQKSLNELTTTGEELRDFAMLHERSRYIVPVEKLLELACSKCCFELNGLPCHAVLNHSSNKVGGNVEVTSRCVNGHCKKWVSSEVLSNKRPACVFK